MKLVVIESPYGPTQEEIQETIKLNSSLPMSEELAYEIVLKRNLMYLRAAMRDCLRRGESPYASHGLYTQEGVLDDKIPEERAWGIQAGFAWRQVAELTVVYDDLGISRGMDYGIADAEKRGVPVEYRQLGEGWGSK